MSLIEGSREAVAQYDVRFLDHDGRVYHAIALDHDTVTDTAAIRDAP